MEWIISRALSIFAFLDYKRNQKLLLQPVGLYYRAAVILVDCNNCLFGGETSHVLGVQLPSLEEYLALPHGNPMVDGHILLADRSRDVFYQKLTGIIIVDYQKH